MNTTAGGTQINTGYNILLVEDDPHVARLIESNLQKVKMECRIAPDGKTALAAFAQKAPHLVLLDLMLPDMTGYEICTKLRQNGGAHSNVPIIMITARDGAEDQLHGLKVGADDYVTKPFDPKLLMARVAAQLRRVHHYDAAVNALKTTSLQMQNAGPNTGNSTVPPDWTRCAGCNYMGPTEKFEELDDQFKLTLICPHCSTRVKQEHVLS
ncbi:MAG TPA: response regulator [Abditibacteriaceae bacterium]|jgi:DNA-binding response OmpR family regulator